MDKLKDKLHIGTSKSKKEEAAAMGRSSGDNDGMIAPCPKSALLCFHPVIPLYPHISPTILVYEGLQPARAHVITTDH